jgi:hypothetical protein
MELEIRTWRNHQFNKVYGMRVCSDYVGDGKRLQAYVGFVCLSMFNESNLSRDLQLWGQYHKR